MQISLTVFQLTQKSLNYNPNNNFLSHYILKLIWKYKDPTIAKSILMKNKASRFILSDTNSY